MALLLLHGFSGHSDDWTDVLSRLPTARAFAEPLLGHRGHAEPERQQSTFDDEVDRLALRIAELRAIPIHAVGYSLGGRLALGLVTRHPEVVARATLIGGQPGLRTVTERMERQRSDTAWVDLLLEGGIEPFAAGWEAQPMFASQRELPTDVVGPSRVRRRLHDPRGLALAIRALGVGAMPNLWPMLPGVRIPVTLVHGEHDSKFGALSQAMAAALPDARVLSIAGVGHNPVLERPAVLAEILST
jgi:2-succinyl-6-hydroxy-2,4-cyclohexadiene-1-carboxylate synthase